MNKKMLLAFLLVGFSKIASADVSPQFMVDLSSAITAVEEDEKHLDELGYTPVEKKHLGITKMVLLDAQKGLFKNQKKPIVRDTFKQKDAYRWVFPMTSNLASGGMLPPKSEAAYNALKKVQDDLYKIDSWSK